MGFWCVLSAYAQRLDSRRLVGLCLFGIALTLSCVGAAEGEGSPAAATDCVSSWVRVASRVVITGPTSVGKTAVVRGLVAIENGHVINADKMYFHSGNFSIGIGLSDFFGMKNEQTHLYRILGPRAEFLNETDYAEKVQQVLKEIGDHEVVFFDGGSKNYLKPLDNAVPGLIKIGLKWPEKFDIRQAIAARVEKALKAGLIEETQRLLDEAMEDSPVFRDSPVYRIVARHLKNEIDLAEMKLQLTNAGENITRSQYRSLKGLKDVVWIESDPPHPEATIEAVRAVMAKIRDTGTVFLGKLPPSGGLEIEFHGATGNDISELKGPVAEGYELARTRYKEAYPLKAHQVGSYFAAEFRLMQPSRSTYMTVSQFTNGTGKVVGFGLLYDGCGSKTAETSTPAERLLPRKNLRTTAAGEPTDNLMELARLSTVKPQASLRDLLIATAHAIKTKYTGVENVPADLNVIGIVENEKLVDYYKSQGFTLKMSPNQTGQRNRWVVEFSGQDLVRTYGELKPGIVN